MFNERDKGGKRAWWREWGQVSQELVHHGMEMWRHSSAWFIPWDTHFLAPGTTLKHTHTHTQAALPGMMIALSLLFWRQPG